MLDTTKERWPPADYLEEFARRDLRLRKMRSGLRSGEIEIRGIKEYYRLRPITFARHWGVTYDPRNAGSETPALLPFVPFRRQCDLFKFVYSCLQAQTSGLNEKSRDMGATWVCCIISAHLFLFWTGASIGWGSRKAMLVDRLGDPDSIFEKIRMQLRYTPRELLPQGFSLDDNMNQMRIVNPETDATITGEAGDDIGRGGRKLIYFKDESAHYEHPESIEASLEATTNVQIDISSVGAPGNVFHRRREAGVEWDPRVGVIPGKTNVFVMDWRQHPGKSQEWYEQRRAKAESEGLLHIFAQEVDRDYFASMQGVVIPAPWIRAAIDAHVKLDLAGDGGWAAALDVADGGGDRNALALRRGIVLHDIQEWGERDTGATARRSAAACEAYCPIAVQYDCIGVGSGVKSETNRLRDDRLLSRGLRFVPWDAGAGPLGPESRVIPSDVDSPKNKDFYANLKAQGWWQLRRRFELTHRAVTLVDEGRQLTSDEMTPLDLARLALRTKKRDDQIYDADTYDWNEDDLISLDSGMPLIWKLVKELSQPTMTKSSRMKLLIEKAPESTVSPNLADAVMMCYWPTHRGMVEISEQVLAASREPVTSQAIRKRMHIPNIPKSLNRPPPAPVEMTPEPQVEKPLTAAAYREYELSPMRATRRLPPAPAQKL